jgi:hypothetical protein
MDLLPRSARPYEDGHKRRVPHRASRLGAALLPADSFQPQSLVVTSEMSTLTVNLDAASKPLSLAPCRKSQAGFQRISMGRYGLQFDVPRRDVVIKLGKVDVDYLVHIVKAKRSDDRVEFWFGPVCDGKRAGG